MSQQKKVRARIQIEGGPSVEGVIISRPRGRGGYFTVWGSTVIEGPDRSFASPANLLIPRERVLFWQELRS